MQTVKHLKQKIKRRSNFLLVYINVYLVEQNEVNIANHFFTL
jgi:hypothetical protein